MQHRISTHELIELTRAPRLQLVDVRPIDAYNGWPMHGEARGGHIAGARTLPFKWASYLDWMEVVQAKQIVPQHPLVVYGSDTAEIEHVASLFERVGFEQVRAYYDFVAEWSSNPDLAMDRLTRYTQLVPPSWLRQLITEQTAPTYNSTDYVICHAHYQNPNDYDVGHIPGALALDTNTLESPDTWNRRSPSEVRATLQQLGISRDTTVVLYGRFSSPDNRDPFPGSSAGQLAAFRCAFIMLWAGVKDVRVLNGGIHSWQDAGFALSTTASVPRAIDDFGGEIPGAPELAVDLPEAKTMLASPNANLVCVRSWPEYIGDVSGYNYIEKKGRIPGAVFAECGSDAYHMENYSNLDHTTREYGEIAAAWQSAGITPDKHNAFYCGTGWRGSEAFFNAWLMGWPRVSVYDGGWYEWSNDPDNPIETGLPTMASATP